MLAVRAGLMRDQNRAEQALRLLGHILDRLHHLDAAGFAAAASVDLGFYPPDRAAELMRGLALSASSTKNAGIPRATGTPNSGPPWPDTREYSCRVL